MFGYWSMLIVGLAVIIPAVTILLTGLIVENVGIVRHVSDNVFVHLNYSTFTNIPHELDLLHNVSILHHEKLTKISNHLYTDVSLAQTFQPLYKQLLVKSNHILTLLTKGRSHFDLIQDSPRQKRGLINALGKLSKILFGTATTEDVENVRKDMYLLTSKTSKVLHTTNNFNLQFSKSLINLKNSLNATNVLLQAINHHELAILELVLSFDTIQTQVILITSIIDTHLRGLVNSMHSLSIDLLNPFELSKIVKQAIQLYLIHPLFDIADISLLYKVVKIYFQPHEVILIIPFTTFLESYDLYHFIPFPTLVNHSLLTWNGTETLFMINNNTLKHSVLSLDFLNHCTILESIFICDSSFFLLTQIQDSCLTQYIFSHDILLDLCTNTRSMSFSHDVIYQTTRQGTYMTLTKQAAMVKCGEDPSIKVDEATFFIPRACTLMTSDLTLIGVTNHSFTYDIQEEVQPTFFQPPNLEEVRLKFIHLDNLHIPINEDQTLDLPMDQLWDFKDLFTEPDYLPMTLITIYAVIATVCLVLCMYCTCKRMSQNSMVIPAIIHQASKGYHNQEVQSRICIRTGKPALHLFNQYLQTQI